MINCPSAQITLASASTRRRELLDQIQVSYNVLAVDIDESHIAGETAEQYVRRLALEKARAGYEKNLNLPALGADTIVLFKQHILGKPRDQQQGMEMLTMLSGQIHQVKTAVAICNGRVEYCLVNTSEVEFAPLSTEQILAYWQTGEPADKAGAYGIQGLAAKFIKNIKGSYSGIMGLPLFETTELLLKAGISLKQGRLI